MKLLQKYSRDLYVVQCSIDQYWVLTDYTHVLPLWEIGSTLIIGWLYLGGISNVVWSMYLLMTRWGVNSFYSDLICVDSIVVALETSFFNIRFYQYTASITIYIFLTTILFIFQSYLSAKPLPDGIHAHHCWRQTPHLSKNCLTCILHKTVSLSVRIFYGRPHSKISLPVNKGCLRSLVEAMFARLQIEWGHSHSSIKLTLWESIQFVHLIVVRLD